MDKRKAIGDGTEPRGTPEENWWVIVAVRYVREETRDEIQK